jgi:hypothetical protein
MKRLNVRAVPDEVYSSLAAAAEARGQSLSAFVVERLTEMAAVTDLGTYVESYLPPTGSGITVEDAVAAVRDVREAA